VHDTQQLRTLYQQHEGVEDALARLHGARRAALLAVAAELFARHGYDATTIRDVAVGAGVSSGYLYQYVASKEEALDQILRAFVVRALLVHRQAITRAGAPRSRFEGLIRASFAMVATDREATVIYQQESRLLARCPRFAYLAEADRRLERIWVDTLERGIEAGEFRPRLEPRLAYGLVRDAIWSTARQQAAPATAQQRLVEQHLAVLVDGVAAH
jgi:AcrR family transcriptional regulator